MKKLFLVCSFMLSVVSISAQDLVVSTQGDSLNCKITKEDTSYIYFTYKQNNEVKNTLIEKSKVLSSQQGYFAQPELNREEIQRSAKQTYQPLKIGLSAGWGYRTAKFSVENDAQKDYMKGLRSGFQLSADIDYYFSDYIGAGLKYSFFQASTSGMVMGSSLKDKTTIHLIAPTFAARILSKSKKNAFIFNYSLGYLGYTDSGSEEGTPVSITAGTLGMVMDIGYEIGISRNLALAFQLSSVTGSFSEYTLNTPGYSKKQSLPNNEKESLARVDLSIGIRFNSGKF